jgi:hypothetical protein
MYITSLMIPSRERSQMMLRKTMKAYQMNSLHYIILSVVLIRRTKQEHSVFSKRKKILNSFFPSEIRGTNLNSYITAQSG